MLRETVVQALSQQINAELYSAYLYLSMSGWCEHEGFPGFANWLRVQAQEELAHGTHIWDYTLERGARAAGWTPWPPRRRLFIICWMFLNRLFGTRNR